MFVSVSEAFVILFLVLILLSIRIRISLTPEDGDKPFSFFVGLQLVPRSSLLGSQDRRDIIDPLNKSRFRLDLPWFLFRVWSNFLRPCWLRGDSQETEYDNEPCQKRQAHHGPHPFRSSRRGTKHKMSRGRVTAEVKRGRLQ